VIDPSARIHSTAEIERDVSVGSGTVVWHRAQIRAGARIGRDCIIGRDVFIDEMVSIGDRVKIQNGALLYRGVTVASGVFIGPGAILTNDRHPRAITSAGSLAQAIDWTIDPIHLDEGASIGAGAIIVAGSNVGRFAMVGAGAVVTHHVRGHELVVGNPAHPLGWVCTCGKRLRDSVTDDDATNPPSSHDARELECPACGRRYEFAGTHPALRERDAAILEKGASA
jgi:UDP-2-acetamido-3-amino-2,3-dideoxy-glucuronate N-acetyltransferase